MKSWNFEDWLSFTVGLAIGGALLGLILMINADKEDAEMISKFMAPLATIIVGGVGTFIAWQQSYTAKEKLRLDLAPRRYEAMDACAQHFAVARIRGCRPPSYLSGISELTPKIHVLFSKEVMDAFWKCHLYVKKNFPIVPNENQYLPVTKDQADEMVRLGKHLISLMTPVTRFE